MTRQLTALLAMVLCVSATAYAMDSLQAEIPFDFTVGDQTFTAGTYRFEPAGKNGSGIVRISALHEMEAIFLLTNKLRRSDTYNQKVTAVPQNSDFKEFCLVFNKYKEQYFLSKMWAGTSGRKFNQSSAEKEAIAANSNNNNESIVIAAMTR